MDGVRILTYEEWMEDDLFIDLVIMDEADVQLITHFREIRAKFHKYCGHVICLTAALAHGDSEQEIMNDWYKVTHLKLDTFTLKEDPRFKQRASTLQQEAFCIKDRGDAIKNAKNHRQANLGPVIFFVPPDWLRDIKDGFSKNLLVDENTWKKENLPRVKDLKNTDVLVFSRIDTIRGADTKCNNGQILLLFCAGVANLREVRQVLGRVNRESADLI